MAIPRPLIILGANGSALDLMDVVDSINAVLPTWKLVGFLDDAGSAGEQFMGLPVLGPLSRAQHYDPEYLFINAIGSDRSYARRFEIVASTGVSRERFATLIHPSSSVSARSSIGHGVAVNYGVSIAGRAVIGDHVWLGPGCIVGHDSAVDAYSILAPGAIVSGFAHVGRSSYVGAGACIRQCLQIGQGALIGMGAVVVRDVASGDRVVGNPAAPLENRTPRSAHSATVR